MNVGDYVRTEDGIIGTLYGTYAYDENQLAILTKTNENGVKYTPECLKDEIINSSPNIIDLIEVGDYVNGRKVYQVGYNFQDDLVLKMNINADGTPNNFEDFIYEKDIKSIITKEQFESMEYKVKE